MTDKRLLEMAAEVMDNSYTPYLKLKSGAAVECDDGSVFTGCTVENISISCTICAEEAAIASAIAAGHRKFKRIAIISLGDIYALPCGKCRQILGELSPGIEVLCARASDGRYVSHKLAALLPLPLTSGNTEN